MSVSEGGWWGERDVVTPLLACGQVLLSASLVFPSLLGNAERF